MAGQKVGTVRVLTARAASADYEHARKSHRSPNFVRISRHSDRLRPFHADELSVLLNLPARYGLNMNASPTETAYLLGSTFGVKSLAWALAPSLEHFPRLG